MDGTMFFSSVILYIFMGAVNTELHYLIKLKIELFSIIFHKYLINYNKACPNIN